jgi:hypothetical protein
VGSQAPDTLTSKPLVERLLEAGRDPNYGPMKLFTEAADEIERLQRVEQNLEQLLRDNVESRLRRLRAMVRELGGDPDAGR